MSNDCLYALGRFLATPENTLGNIISTFNAPLLVFANPVVDAATSHSDFDLSMLRRRRISIYVGIQPNRLSDAALLINMFFTQVIDLNTKELPECNPGIRYECLIALDELIALGKIHILAKANPYIRGYGLRLLTLIQSVAQLSAVYGEADARTLITNHAVQIAYAPQEQRDAEDYSKMLGMATQVALSRSSNSPRSWGVAGSVSESRSDHGRALMLPQELKMMRKHQQIVFIKNTRPILCDKARYYEDHRFLDRLKAASPFLASLDATGLRQLLRTAGLHGLAKAVPSQQQIKHAAFVLQELSIDIPALNLATTMPASAYPQYCPPPPEPSPIDADIDYPGSDSLPRFADPQCPSKEEATAIVHAFFEQLSAARRAPHGEPNSIAADNGAAAPASAARPIQPQDGSTVAEPAHPDLPPAAPSKSRQPQSGCTPIDLSVLDP